MSYTVYILECHNGSYYVGITTDLLRRYQEHLQGINCRYTRAFPPKRVAAAWHLENGDKSTAQKIEYFLKKQNKVTKTRLLGDPESLAMALTDTKLSIPNLIITVIPVK
jgi:putative endonuclease